mmetsp:Transcript_1679/g.3684  ORF Transcript_1679/g.3684 Transcript_1679/m.3684 type:complete len:273 (-) Transcript_1679:384-1202(-)|eukprot:CAMPEP_0206449234 /NCGR_PEP_ID=MMETSP0324_2-20121206/17964_1 /ASSEMBLY_ACC=CAM_ASM_000836 /TAXON_ID=2866 /ORGANISM="Crypthecodinium cohnii, Strain Seligo" /LENGTH=272 /DNA_ID=CAMNT_0053918565 /DNA_START=189 /DNA_END=1007 /DNA_ORIENTATION=-
MASPTEAEATAKHSDEVRPEKEEEDEQEREQLLSLEEQTQLYKAEARKRAEERSATLTAQCNEGITYVPYQDEQDMPSIVKLIEKDLSEPYSVFTYRYFINNWPELCFRTMQGDKCIGAIVCKLDIHRSRSTNRGYIAMLAVDKDLRGKRIGSKLVQLCLDQMRDMGADECVLETEVTNSGALALYRSMGFVKDKRLHKYYLNGNDAYRLKYLFRLPEGFYEGLGCQGPLVDPPKETLDALGAGGIAEKPELEEKEDNADAPPSTNGNKAAT